MKKEKHTLRIIRRILFAVMTVFTFIIQFTILPRTPLGFPVFLLIPLLISESMFEKEMPALFYGALTGALWDLSSGMTDGLLALIFAAAGLITGILSRRILRNTLLNTLIITTVCSIIYSALAIVATPGKLGYTLFISVCKQYYIPAVLVSAVLTVPVYFMIRAVALKLRDEKS